MVLKFTTQDKVYHSEMNNVVFNSRNAVKSGCLVSESSPTGMKVDVASGQVFFGTSIVSVSSVSNLAIAPSDPNDDRFDLIVVNSSGIVSVIDGTSGKADISVEPGPQPADYDPELFIVLARVLVNDAVTTILNANITDSRVIGGGAGGSGGIGKFSETFTSQTSVSVNHSLNDTQVLIQVYDSLNEQITPDKIDIIDANNILVEFATSTTGTIIVHGGVATVPDGGVATFLHNQTSALSTWTVTHNLNDSNPVIEVYDSTGNPIEPQSINITNNNEFTVTFGSAITGSVRVLAGKFTGGTGGGNFLPTVDDSFDIGSATFRWQDLHLSSSIFLGILTADPSSPTTGQIWFNSTDSQFKGYNGTSIVILG